MVKKQNKYILSFNSLGSFINSFSLSPFSHFEQNFLYNEALFVKLHSQIKLLKEMSLHAEHSQTQTDKQ